MERLLPTTIDGPSLGGQGQALAQIRLRRVSVTLCGPWQSSSKSPMLRDVYVTPYFNGGHLNATFREVAIGSLAPRGLLSAQARAKSRLPL
jgi:hypothetical protein